MPALRGSLTYARFFVEGDLPDDLHTKLLKAIRLRVMKPLDPDEEALERSGWCRIGEPMELELGHEEVFYNDYVNLGFRTDRWAIPGPFLRAKLREAEQAYLLKKGRERLTRKEKAELKQLVSKRLRKQMDPRTTAVDMSWSLDERIVRFFSASPKMGALLEEHFTKTFASLKLVPEAPYTLAARLGLSKEQSAAWDAARSDVARHGRSVSAMQLVDRIETRRFVGREFLLWLWFESELFEGTLRTKEHGSFGLWIEKSIVLSNGKTEVTRIRGVQPAAAREAKEALRRGKMPESAGFHLVQGERESSFSLRAEQLGIAGLKLPTVLGGAEEEVPAALVLGPPRAPRRRKRESVDQQDARESDEAHEAFYERMQLTRDFEAVIEALYRDFLAIRLGVSWSGVVEAMHAWAAGTEVDADAYRATRAGGKRRPTGKKTPTRAARVADAS